MSNDRPENGDEDRYVYGQLVHQVIVTIDQMGTMTRNLSVCDYMIDTETNKLVQVGGEVNSRMVTSTSFRRR